MNTRRFTLHVSLCRLYRVLLLLLLAALLSLPPLALAQSGDGYDLTWSTVDGGGYNNDATADGGVEAAGGVAVAPADGGVVSGGGVAPAPADSGVGAAGGVVLTPTDGGRVPAVSYTHLTLPRRLRCRSRWSPYH